MTNNFHGWGFAHAHTYTLTDTVLPLAPLVRLCLYVQADTLGCLGPHDLGVAEAYARSPTISRGVVLGARPHAWVADALARCVSRVVHSSGSGGLSFTRTPRNTRLAPRGHTATCGLAPPLSERVRLVTLISHASPPLWHRRARPRPHAHFIFVLHTLALLAYGTSICHACSRATQTHATPLSSLREAQCYSHRAIIT